MVATVVSMLLDSPRPLTIEIWLFDRFGHRSDEELFRSFQTYLERTLALQITDVPKRGAAIVAPPSDTDVSRSVEPSRPVRLRQISDALRMLDLRQAAVEGELITALATDGTAATTIADNQLRRIKNLRRGYEEDWERLLGRGPDFSGNAVFLSSTYEDLKTHRTELRKTIEGLPLPFIGMEDFHPNEQLPVEFIRGELKKAGIYFGVLGMRYGSIDPATGLSMTELEYRQAVVDKKKLCVFLIADDAPITVRMVDPVRRGLESWSVSKRRSWPPVLAASSVPWRTSPTTHWMFCPSFTPTETGFRGSCLLPEWEVASITPWSVRREHAVASVAVILTVPDPIFL